jgi:CheY-like chemotaxis protein
MLAKYHVDMVKLDCFAEMAALVQSQKTIDKHQNYIFLVQGDLFRAQDYKRLATDGRCALLTFGPHRLPSDRKTDFPSLTRVLPCVIAKSMIARLEVIRINQDSFDGETPSTTVPRQKTFDYLGVRALIAEDNQINQKLLLRMLQQKGIMHIDVVNDGHKAVDAVLLYKKDYDIIFMDNQMPTMDGIEACQLICARIEKGRRLPEIVFITANISDAFKRDALRAGCNGFIKKPFTAKAIDTYFHTQTKLTNRATVLK